MSRPIVGNGHQVEDISEYITARRRQKASDKTIRNEIGSLRSTLKREATLLAACARSRSR